MAEECFYLRCALCSEMISVEWGPETHSTATRLLIEHVESHSDLEMREFAMRWLVGSNNLKEYREKHGVS